MRLLSALLLAFVVNAAGRTAPCTGSYYLQPGFRVVRQQVRLKLQPDITSASAKYNKTDSNTIEFPLTIPADGEQTVIYSVHYA
jgi:hypothetical protein